MWAQSRNTTWLVEAGDQYGYSVVAGTTSAGAPFVIAGAPGEAVGDLDNAGAVVYQRPGFASGITQDSANVPGIVEAGDLFGYSLAATPRGFALGIVGEAVVDVDYSGSVHVFDHPASAGLPPNIAGWDQDYPGFSGLAEPGDLYGYSLSMIDYKLTSTGAVKSLVAIGVPGEALGSVNGAGRVVVVDDSGSIAEWDSYAASDEGVSGGIGAGDFFGADVALVNRTPNQAATWQNLLLAVGIPGEDVEETIDRGWVQVFSMIGEPGDHDVSTDDALASAGIEWESGTRIGTTVHATVTHLWVADPWSTDPAVYGIPWENLTSGGSATVLKRTPADFGLTAADAASFGASLT